MPPIYISAATRDDHAAWLPLWQAYQRFYQVQIPEKVTEATWQRMHDAYEPINAALAWHEGKAVGMVHFIYHRSCWTIEPSCYLQDLLVTEGQRGLGIGRRLIEYVYAQAKAAGCSRVHWLTQETNAQAIGLYEHVADRPGFIQFRKTL